MYDNRYFQIDSIATVFPTLNTTEFGIGVVDYNNISGIPLTEKILLGCGFVRNLNIDYRFHHLKIDITIDMDDFGLQISDTWEFGTIRYLHELQNLFYSLTKTELTINL